MYYRLSEFWRVGYHASPLDVSLEYQDGSGPFDDPERKLTVLYGGDSATTCILEVTLPWEPHVDASYVQQAEAPGEDMDADYLAGQTKPRRKIMDGINSPFDVAVDSQDHLYVSNAYGGTVTIYGLRGETLLRTIRSGIVSPKFLALSSR